LPSSPREIAYANSIECLLHVSGEFNMHICNIP
jgi:hypothetical protein